MLKKILNSIMNDLNRISKVNRNDLFKNKVQNTINVSYESYCHNLKVNYDYLLYRDTMQVLKTIKKEKAKREKKNEV